MHSNLLETNSNIPRNEFIEPNLKEAENKRVKLKKNLNIFLVLPCRLFNISFVKEIGGNLIAYRVDNLKLNPEFCGVVAKAGTTKSNIIKYAKKQSGWFGTDGADNVMPKNPLTEEQ